MKVLLFSGTHSRHVYIHEQILKNFDVCGVVVMEREPTIPGENIKGNKNKINNWPLNTQELYKQHFNKRDKIEKQYYQNKNIELYNSYCDVLKTTPSTLNSDNVKQFIQTKSPDVCFIFGTNLIKDNLLEVMPDLNINLHLGLSPWYRGSATLFWPFYNLQPQFAGSTFHQIINEPDAGDILHQTIPILKKGETMHEVCANVVLESAKDAIKLLKKIKENNDISLQKQKNSGKNWLIKDFEPHHLDLIYNLYNDKIVDEYLKGNLGNRQPKLIKAF
jgi:methionyl-tRNA formyltransferase